MRTKTLALSAVLSALGSTALYAQTNVYSLNAVGYINVTMPAGFTIVTCPLIASPDNSVNTLFNNSTSQYQGATIYPFVNGGAFSSNPETANPFGPGWEDSGPGGTNTLLPGQAVFFYNGSGTAMSATFVGTVPQGSLTNALQPGYNLVGSIVPVATDYVTNSITTFNDANPGSGDTVYFFNPANQQYAPTAPTYEFGSWSVDPINTNVAFGFFYYNAGQGGTGTSTPAGPAGTEVWVENFTINP